MGAWVLINGIWYNSLSGQSTSGDLKVTCNATTPYSVKLSSGAPSGFSLRGAIPSNTDIIPYNVTFTSRSGGVTPGTGAVAAGASVTSKSVIGGTSKVGFSTNGANNETLTFTFSTNTVPSVFPDTYTDQVTVLVEY